MNTHFTKKITITTFPLLFSIGLIPSICYADDMDTLVVTASGFEQQVKDAPASISVLTAETIKKKPYRDVTSAIADIPGVDVIGNGASTDISIRGMDPRYTLMLVDGKRVNVRETSQNGYDKGLQQGWLPPLSAIERIEVIRGPMSSLYGSDAMGGVINIITKKENENWTGNVRLEAIVPEASDAKNVYNTNFSLRGPLIQDKLNASLYGQYSDRNEDKYIGGHAAKRLRSLNGSLSYQLTDNQNVDLDFGKAWQNTEAKLGNSRTKKDKSNYYRHEQRSNIIVSHQAFFDAFTTNSSLAFEENKNSIQDARIKNTEFNTKFLIPFETVSLTVGGQYLYQDLYDGRNTANPTLTKINRWSYALFGEDEWHIVDDFALTTGLRLNKDEKYGTNWNPRIYGVWDLNPNYTLKGGYSTGYTAPQLRYVISDWGQITGQGSGVILGNPNLKPEKSENYELSLSYLNDSGFNASATVFYTKFKDKIETYYSCNNNSCTYNGKSYTSVQHRENIDKAEVKGVEITMKSPLMEKLSLTTNYAYLHSKQLSGANKGLPLNNTPKHKFNVQLDWDYSDSFSYWIKMAYTGKEIETSTKGSKGLGTKYPSHTVFDVGGTYRINNQVSLYSGIYNFLDKKIIDEDYGKTLEGRRYWLGLDIQF